jgi:glycosyltransferase involved in cell wall biosynthesis
MKRKQLTNNTLAILNLDYPKDKLKIIIVDDGSTDNTWLLFKNLKITRKIECLKKENGGKYTALEFWPFKSDNRICWMLGC